ARAIAGPELADKVGRVAANPDDVQALYDAAYELYEQGLHAVAAALLMRANGLAPGQRPIVTELCACLEALLRYGEAALVVDVSGLAESDPLCAYLSGFSWLMVGDRERPRERLRQLAGASEGPIPFVREALAGMLARADALAAVSPLDERALSAWHLALNGTLLTHESPHGHEGPMHGRYAYVSDSPGLMREGLERLGAVLAGRLPSRVVAAPDRASRILARAASELFGRPLEPWGGAAPSDALVVIWSFARLDDMEMAKALREHAPGQVLFVHASDWLRPFGYAPDVTTFLHQVVTHPYLGGALRVDPATQAVAPAEPDERDDDTLAREILAAPIGDPSASSLEHLLSLRDAVERVTEPHGAGLFRRSGLRTRERAGSPVPSARFT
ncbi:MAG TPA: hypothetical protein VFS00_01110, partial [Polyangiaceae bacterium]|nr:hypothetical protein [Polyangiaceae bacterium]